MPSTRVKIAGLVMLAVATVVAAAVAASAGGRARAAPRAKLQRAVDRGRRRRRPRARSRSSATATARCASPAATRNLATRTPAARDRPLPRRQRRRRRSSPRSCSSSPARASSRLEDSVERWLPGLVPNGGAITVRQLLNHTSGLADYAPDEDDTFIRRVLADRHRSVDAARARRASRTAQPPLFAPGAALVVLEHGLHPARADRRGGERQPARDGAARARSSRRCACAPRASTPGRGSPGATRTATRASARSAASTSASLNQSWAGAAGRDRLDRGRPRALPPRPARRAPAAPRPARADAHDRRPPAPVQTVRARADQVPPSLRHLLGPRRRDARLPSATRTRSAERPAPGDDRPQRRPEPPHAARPASARASARDRLLRLRPSQTARLGVATDAIRGSGRQYARGRGQRGGTKRTSLSAEVMHGASDRQSVDLAGPVRLRSGQRNERGGARSCSCAGQTSVDPDGQPLHEGDVRAQVGQALDNLETVLREAGFALADVIRLNYYVTDVECVHRSGRELRREARPGRLPASVHLARGRAPRAPTAARRNRSDRSQVARRAARSLRGKQASRPTPPDCGCGRGPRARIERAQTPASSWGMRASSAPPAVRPLLSFPVRRQRGCRTNGGSLDFVVGR